MSKHHSHPRVLKRLQRAHGHLAKTIRMIEAGEPCLDVAQQLQAVANAVINAKAEFVRDHIEHCLDDVLVKPSGRSRAALDEFKQITKYL